MSSLIREVKLIDYVVEFADDEVAAHTKNDWNGFQHIANDPTGMGSSIHVCSSGNYSNHKLRFSFVVTFVGHLFS